jgi:hypothetical protein
MRRFAKLTKGGAACYVDPALVGAVFVVSGQTGVLSRAKDGPCLLAQVEESPEETYKRLAAASEVVTRMDIAAAEAEMDAALIKALHLLRRPDFTLITAYGAEQAVLETLEPFRIAVDKLKKTVLAALWVAEGEDPHA